jgi:hypothetical protein
LYRSIEELQKDVDEWIKEYNEERTHSGKYCFGKTPMQTFKDSKKIAKEKMIDENWEASENHFWRPKPPQNQGALA